MPTVLAYSLVRDTHIPLAHEGSPMVTREARHGQPCFCLSDVKCDVERRP